MGFQQSEVLSEEWEVVEAVAKLIHKNPRWLANFGVNRAEDRRIRNWDLRSAGLRSLPDNIGNLIMLETLDLGANMIRELPPSFGKLINLSSLTINSDVLFPPELFQLENLTQVDTRDKGAGGGTRIAILNSNLWNRRPIDSCPRRCNRVVKGVCGDMEEVSQRKYELECKNFTRFLTGGKVAVYYCTLYEQDTPYCNRCLFPSYIVDPRRGEIGLIE